MNSHLAFAGFLFLGSLTPLAYLNVKLWGREWSAFRVLLLWLLLTTCVLIPLVWVDFVLYSQLAWPARAVTVGLMLGVVLELWGASAFVCFVAPLLAMAGVQAVYEAAPAYLSAVWRSAGFAIFAACLLDAIVRAASRRTWSPRAAGLAIYALFPAISEIPSVMQNGGWLRLVPTISAWIAFAIWWATSDTTLDSSARPLALRHR